MNLMRWEKCSRSICAVAGLVLISALTGCNRDEAKVYHLPKDTSTPPAQPEPMTAAPDAGSQPQMMTTPPQASLPQLKYQVPAGWQEKPPTDMRVASFTAPGANGQTADVSVIPLPVIGRDLELINMWRSKVQLPATSDPNAANQAKPVAIGSDQGRLFEFVSDNPVAGKTRQRLVVAMLTQPGMSWFFKITGDDECVASQKAKFIEFLKSVSFTDAAAADQMAAPPASMPAPPPQSSTPIASDSIWTVPPGWQSVPPSQFLLAEFSIPGANGAKAEVNVAAMGGTGGGLLANINRWRGQIGLGAVTDGDLPQFSQPLDVPGGKATLVDLTGTDGKTGVPTRLVGAIVDLNGQTWFYKMMGDKQIVAQQKDAFSKFILSANYANVR
jgi:hypothetical protein